MPPIDKRKNSSEGDDDPETADLEAEAKNNMFEKQVSHAIEFVTDLHKQFASMEEKIDCTRKTVHDVSARQEHLEKMMEKMIEEHHERIAYMERKLRELTSLLSSSS